MTARRKPRALILFAPGTNRDQDAAAALDLAGAEPVVCPIKYLREERVDWSAYQIMVIPGGFSYADALGAGKLFALDLIHYFYDQAHTFVSAGKPVLGICNGFQALVKSGLLPDGESEDQAHTVTLTFNESNHFECRWVTLKPVSERCLWTRGLRQLIECPVAHGEGNFTAARPEIARALLDTGQAALIYTQPDGSAANGGYPHNPNGSMLDIAGICNPQGNVLGLMPHPEDNIHLFQKPDRSKGPDHPGLPLFVNGVRFTNEA